MIATGYWYDWVTRPGDKATLHLSGAGETTVTLHPLDGNKVAEPNNDLVWWGNLVERSIVPGSAASEQIKVSSSNHWSLSFGLRLESAPKSSATVAVLSTSGVTGVKVIYDGFKLAVIAKYFRFEKAVELEDWLILEITCDGTTTNVSLNKRQAANGDAVSFSGEAIPIPTEITFGSDQSRGAHFRICDAQIVGGLDTQELFTDPSKSIQKNNPVWGLSNGQGGHSAIQFHPEDIGDVEWPATVGFSLPNDLPPGMYTAKCQNASGTTHIPLFVEPRAPKNRVAVLMSTFTYLAYAGYRQGSEAATLGDYSEVTDRDVQLTDIDRRLATGVEPGWSLYDKYSNGTVTHLACRRHPLIDFVPGHIHWLTHTTRNFCTDLELLHWLDQQGIEFDLLTDDSLHIKEPADLNHYDIILTGCHPEYVSAEILDNLQHFIETGGHLLYLGGNGFELVAAPSLASPADTIEIRRTTNFAGVWPGADPEDNQLSGKRPAGRWSDVGRPPNQLVGVGFCSQGWGPAPGYVQLPEARSNTSGQEFFAGIDPDEMIGDFGHSLGGAAGDEIDCVGLNDGTPKATIRLATSEGLHTHHMMDLGRGKPIRSDIAFTPNDSGGSVFAVGSMNWIPSLIVEREANNVEKMTQNAIRLAKRNARSKFN